MLCFFLTLDSVESAEALRKVESTEGVFSVDRALFFGVSVNPSDRSLLSPSDGRHYFWDFDGSISRLYGALPNNDTSQQVRGRRFWLVLDPNLRVRARFSFDPTEQGVSAVLDYVRSLPAPQRFDGVERSAPVLHVSNVFSSELCNALIEQYNSGETFESGFMQDKDGKTVLVTDSRHKRRQDYLLNDPNLIRQIQGRIRKSIVPEVLKVYQFRATRMERYIVGGYSEADQGHFRAHRDNTTRGTAHRRFAVSINLNADYEGGELCFPEYSTQTFKPEPGAAIVFSCSLLHAVTPVTHGKRYVFLPFLYDEEAARQRTENNQFLSEGLGHYNG